MIQDRDQELAEVNMRSLLSQNASGQVSNVDFTI